MRAVFTVYLLLIICGIVFFSIVGIANR